MKYLLMKISDIRKYLISEYYNENFRKEFGEEFKSDFFELMFYFDKFCHKYVKGRRK